jgi:Holliday junction resolvase RusA-like endonuclease
LVKFPIMIEIPGDPVAKGRPRVTKEGVAYTPAKTKRWETTAKWFCASKHRGDLIDTPVRLVVNVYFAIPVSWPKYKKEHGRQEMIWHTTKPDLDNVLKAACDALVGTVLSDDALICSITVTKRYSSVPRLHIEINEIDEP